MQMEMKCIHAYGRRFVLFLLFFFAASTLAWGCKKKEHAAKETSQSSSAAHELEKEEDRLPAAPGPLPLQRPTPPLPLKSNPLDGFRPFADRALRGMTTQLKGGSLDEAYPDLDIHSGEENRLRAFLAVADLAGFKKAKGMVLGFDLFLFRRGKNVLVVKTTVMVDSERAAFADFRVERGFKKLPDRVYPLSAFSRGFATIKEAATELSVVLNTSSCNLLPVLHPTNAEPWFPPDMAKQVGEDLAKTEISMKDSCALIATYEWDEVRVRPADLNFLVVDSKGEPAGQIQTTFSEKGDKPALMVQGRVRSFKPIGAKR